MALSIFRFTGSKFLAIYTRSKRTSAKDSISAPMANRSRHSAGMLSAP